MAEVSVALGLDQEPDLGRMPPAEARMVMAEEGLTTAMLPVEARVL